MLLLLSVGEVCESSCVKMQILGNVHPVSGPMGLRLGGASAAVFSPRACLNLCPLHCMLGLGLPHTVHVIVGTLHSSPCSV